MIRRSAKRSRLSVTFVASTIPGPMIASASRARGGSQVPNSGPLAFARGGGDNDSRPCRDPTLAVNSYMALTDVQRRSNGEIECRAARS